MQNLVPSILSELLLAPIHTFRCTYKAHPCLPIPQVDTSYLDHKAVHKPQSSHRHSVLEVGHCLPRNICKLLLDSTALVRGRISQTHWTSVLCSMDLICSIKQAWIYSIDHNQKHISLLQTNYYILDSLGIWFRKYLNQKVIITCSLLYTF